MSIRKPSAPQTLARILLVDDNRNGLAARRSVLEELGHTVVPASNGLEGWDAANAQSFDLIITDWKMPKLDGLELIRRLKEIHYPAPVVLLTGYADSTGLAESSTGADAILQKSANEIPMLLGTVKRLLSKKPARKPPASQTAAKSAKPRTKTL